MRTCAKRRRVGQPVSFIHPSIQPSVLPPSSLPSLLENRVWVVVGATQAVEVLKLAARVAGLLLRRLVVRSVEAAVVESELVALRNEACVRVWMSVNE